MINFSDFQLSDLKKTYPPKSGLTLVIGFDTVHKSVRFWRTLDLNFIEADVQEFPYKESFLSEEFYTEFGEICANYVAAMPDKQMASYLVMPDCMISMDNVSLPHMPRKNRDAALNSHLQNLYKNYKELQFNKYIISSNKQYVTFFLTILKKARLTELYRAMTDKLQPKETTFTGNCLINSVLHFKPHLRKKSFILLDIHNVYTNVAVCVKGRTAAFTSFMLGTTHLSSQQVLQENMQYDHDVADLAIINAKEKARMKQLTVAGTDLEAEVNDIIRQFDEGDQNESTVESAKGKEGDLQSVAEDLASSAEEREIAAQFDAEDAADEAERQNELLEQQLEQARKKKVFARKMPKRLPKFMLRPEPTDEQGFIYENFRMFIKWAMLYYKWIREQEYLHEFDCVLVNMPEKYAFLIDRANEEEKSELPFEYIGDLGGKAITDNLDMIGALFAGVYNKRENF